MKSPRWSPRLPGVAQVLLIEAGWDPLVAVDWGAHCTLSSCPREGGGTTVDRCSQWAPTASCCPGWGPAHKKRSRAMFSTHLTRLKTWTKESKSLFESYVCRFKHNHKHTLGTHCVYYILTYLYIEKFDCQSSVVPFTKTLIPLLFCDDQSCILLKIRPRWSMSLSFYCFCKAMSHCLLPFPIWRHSSCTLDKSNLLARLFYPT